MQDNLCPQQAGHERRKDQEIRHIMHMNDVIPLFQMQACNGDGCQQCKPAPAQNSCWQRLPKAPVHGQAIDVYLIAYFKCLLLLLAETEHVYLKPTIYRCSRNSTDQRIKGVPIIGDSSYMDLCHAA